MSACRCADFGDEPCVSCRSRLGLVDHGSPNDDRIADRTVRWHSPDGYRGVPKGFL